mgnify:CR=1 FL=1
MLEGILATIIKILGLILPVWIASALIVRVITCIKDIIENPDMYTEDILIAILFTLLSFLTILAILI